MGQSVLAHVSLNFRTNSIGSVLITAPTTCSFRIITAYPLAMITSSKIDIVLLVSHLHPIVLLKTVLIARLSAMLAMDPQIMNAHHAILDIIIKTPNA